MTNGEQKQPKSIVIQTAQVQESAPSQSTLAGQINALPNNQIILQQGLISNGPAMVSAIPVIPRVRPEFAIPFDIGPCCRMIWLFALLAVIFGHIGASQGSKTGVGGGQGVAGLVLGYLTLAGYLLPFLLLGSIGAGASI